MTSSNYVIGVDIGGTHCTAALIDLEQKKIVSSTLRRVAIDANGKAGEIIAAWSGCILSVGQQADTASVCLAMPGPFDYEAGISLMQGQHKYESLYGLNIKELLAKALHITPAAIFIGNDAACFLQGEVFGGIAGEYVHDTIIGITLGTGLGSAVYRNGMAQNADLWQLPFKNGIAEDCLSTRWFLQRFSALTGTAIEGVKELAQLAETNKPARVVFSEFGVNLGQFLLDFIKTENPQAVVIGGNISNAFGLFKASLQSVVLDQYPSMKIERSILGEEAPLLGAAGSRAHQLSHLKF